MYGICWSILLMMIGLFFILIAEYNTYILVYVGVCIELISAALLFFSIHSSKKRKAALIEKRKENQEKEQIEKERIEQQAKIEKEKIEQQKQIEKEKIEQQKQIEKEKIEQQEQIEKEKIEQQEQREKAALKIYKKCSENNITDFNSKKNCESLLLIANSFGIEDLEEAKEMFYSEKAKHEQQTFLGIRKDDQELYDESVKVANYRGKDKYLNSLEKDLELLKNKKSRYTWKLVTEIEMSANNMVEHIENRLFDDKNQKEKFKMLNISDISYEINAGYNFEVKFKYNVSGEIKLLESPAVLDGSLKISIYDKEKKLVAMGYYNARAISKFDFNYKSSNRPELSSVGFSGKSALCICISNNYEEIDKNSEYDVVIEPNYLWIIEI